MIDAESARMLTKQAHHFELLLRTADGDIRHAAKNGRDYCSVEIPNAVPAALRAEVIAALRQKGFTVKHRWYNLCVSSSNYIWVGW
jgi:hypothetical protein